MPDTRIDFGRLSEAAPHTIELVAHLLGGSGPGYCLIHDIPDYVRLRSSLLKMGHELLLQPKERLRPLRSESEEFYVGYSDTPFVTDDGVAHTKHTSFVARPLRDSVVAPELPVLERGLVNRWPDDPQFCAVFKDLGRVIARCELLLFKLLCEWLGIRHHTFSQEVGRPLAECHDIVLRLINYFPSIGVGDDARTWDGWHTDYGLLTALTHPVYWDVDGERINCPRTSLWVKDRAGTASEVTMPEDCLLVLPSNAMMILSGGLIPTTAHQVVAGEGVPRSAHRTTLASFFQPQPGFPMAIPGGLSLADIKAGSFHMSDFFETGLTFGTYSDRLLDYLLTRCPQPSPTG